MNVNANRKENKEAAITSDSQITAHSNGIDGE
jgi:hypothetical protein